MARRLPMCVRRVAGPLFTNDMGRACGSHELARWVRTVAASIGAAALSALSFGDAAVRASLPGARAEDGVRRLAASAYPQIPAWLDKALSNASCEIPQFGLERRANNIVAGRFIKHTRIDWAVVCSSCGTSKILIFSRALSVPVEVMPMGQDKSGLYNTGYGFEYAVSVGRISASDARRAAQRFDERLPDSIRAAGILIGQKEAAASALFLYRGEWIEVATAD